MFNIYCFYNYSKFKIKNEYYPTYKELLGYLYVKGKNFEWLRI